jgi:hypothetical protein
LLALLTALQALLAALLAAVLTLLTVLLGGLLLELLGLLLELAALLGRLLLELAALLAHLTLLALLGHELPRLGVARRHLVWLLGLTVRGLELTRYLLGCHARCALGSGLGRMLLGQPDLLVDLALLLLALLFVLGRLLDELPGLGVAGLEFRLDGLVLTERLAVSRVRGALVGTAALGTREAALLSVLALLAVLLVSLVTHDIVSRSCVELRKDPVVTLSQS